MCTLLANPLPRNARMTTSPILIPRHPHSDARELLQTLVACPVQTLDEASHPYTLVRPWPLLWRLACLPRVLAATCSASHPPSDARRTARPSPSASAASLCATLLMWSTSGSLGSTLRSSTQAAAAAAAAAGARAWRALRAELRFHDRRVSRSCVSWSTNASGRHARCCSCQSCESVVPPRRAAATSPTSSHAPSGTRPTWRPPSRASAPPPPTWACARAAWPSRRTCRPPLWRRGWCLSSCGPCFTTLGAPWSTWEAGCTTSSAASPRCAQPPSWWWPRRLGWTC